MGGPFFCGFSILAAPNKANHGVLAVLEQNLKTDNLEEKYAIYGKALACTGKNIPKCTKNMFLIHLLV